MDLFNKKKVSKLEEEIKLLKKEIEVKNDVLRKLRTPNAVEYLEGQNKKLMNWILDLIEHNGYEVPEQVPYFKIMSRLNPTPYMDSFNNGRITEERYVLPMIEIARMKEE